MNNMYDILAKMNLLESRGSRPDFPDIDKDGDRTEPINKAAKEVDEASYSAKAARAGKDIGKPGKNFEKIAKSAAERYGSKERGEKVAGAVLAKLRAKESIDEADMEEGNDFTGARLAAIKAGKPTFKVDGKTYRVTGDTSDERRMDEGYVDFMDKKEMYRRIGAEVEGRSDDYTVTFKDGSRKRYQELDGRRRVTSLEPVDAPEEQDDEGNVVKRGRGRPKGSKRALGAKGPTGRSKLLTREDYDKDEYDEEGEMAKTQARTIADAAAELQSILDADENLPEWVQKKITLAKEYIDSARDYLKANRPEGDEMSLPEDADSGFTQADWNRVVGLKRMLMRMNPKLEPEDAEQRAAEKLGYDYEDVLAWIESDQNLEEKAVSKAQRRAAGIAHAAKKGAIPKSELRGASKEMAKMAGGELKKFAKTKEKGLPEKVKEEDKEEVDETTTSGSVATAPSTGKTNGIFGKGVYESQISESFNRKLLAITEGMSINMSMGENGEKSLSVNATDDDAIKLAHLLKLAGMEQANDYHEVCPSCGESPCGCDTLEEADLANSPEPEYAELGSTGDYGLAGGLNGPKLQSNPNNMADNPLAMSRLGTKASPNLNLGAVAEDIEQKLENRLIDLYKRIS